MRLWLVRHARVQLAEGLCYGASDVPADPAHTQQVAEALAADLPERASVRVSGLKRARQMADAVRSQRPDLDEAQIDVRLNEMNFGQWERQRWDAIPRSAFDAWMADFPDHRFGGLESTQQVIARVAGALADTRAAGGEAAVWFTHAGVIRAVQFLLAHPGGCIAGVRQWPEHAPEPGGTMEVRL
jgi:alpha-ribazole phosphatase